MEGLMNTEMLIQLLVALLNVLSAGLGSCR